MDQEVVKSAPEETQKTPFFKRPCFFIGLAVFFIALILRLVYIYNYTNNIGIDFFRFEQTDNHTFHQWACAIAEGDWLCEDQIHPYHEWTARVAPKAQWLKWYGNAAIYHQAPLYPYIVGMIYALAGQNPDYVRIFQCLTSALSVLLVFLTARHYFGRTTGLAASLLLAFSGFHFYYDAFILREGLIAFLTILFIFLSVLAFSRKSWLLFFAAGLTLGLGVAAKPNAMLLIPVYLAALFLCFKQESLFRRMVRIVFFMMAIPIPLLPLFVRNAKLGCPVTKISTRGPTAFINGNLRGQTGAEWAPPDVKTRAILMESDYQLSGVISETLKSYADNPLAYVQLLWDKTKALFNSYEIPNNTNYYLIQSVSPPLNIAFVSYWFVSSAALLGILLLLPSFQRIWQLYWCLIVLALSFVAFFIVARFRQPIVPILAIFAGYAVVWILKKLKTRRIPALIAAIAVLGAFLSWTTHDKLTYSSHMSAFSGVMIKLISQNQYEKAEIYKDKLLDAFNKNQKEEIPPGVQEKLEMIKDAFGEFKKTASFTQRDAQYHLHAAEGFRRIMGVTKRSQYEELLKIAQDHAEKALLIDPKLKGPNKTMGVCYIELIKRKTDPTQIQMLLSKAYKYFHKELQLNPDDPECLKAMGFCSQTFGLIDAAIGYYKNYLSKAKEYDYEIASQIAALAIRQPKGKAITLDQALELGKKAYDHDPKNLKFCRTYSDLLYLKGNIDGAIKILHEMIPLDPDKAKEHEKRIELFKKAQENKKQGSDTQEEDQTE